VIDGDEWLARLLGRVLEEAGWTADVCVSAREGFEKACETLPDSIVCSVDLPDIDGLWVARRVRTEHGAVARTPFVILGEVDREARVQALRVGADLVLARPVTNEEIVAHLEALMAMARRVRGDAAAKEPESSTSLAAPAALRGDLSLFPLASLLMMLEMERRTGTLDVKSDAGKRGYLVINGGLFSVTEIDGEQRPPLEVLREVLSWRVGTFAFRPRDGGALPPPRASVGAIVLEAMRLEDEKSTGA
jgi:CheY-like chemotaxis protein